MKALITAGGRATRLRPITWTINKHLIPLANKAMIIHAIEKIVGAGITEIGINVSVGDREIAHALGDGSRFGARLTYIEQIGGPLGLGHILKIAEPFLAGEPFVFYLGDNIILGSIAPLVEKFQNGKFDVLLALARVNDPARFGVPEIRDGKILRIIEKPVHPPSAYAVTGIYCYSPKIWPSVHAIAPSARGEYEISDVHTHVIESGHQVGYEEITGWWKDTGKPDDLLEGNALLLNECAPETMKIEAAITNGAVIQGKVRIGKGTTLAGQVLIRGPVSIGENCQIENSYIGPYTSVGSSVKVINTEVEHSIIFDGAVIRSGKRIVDSLIGRDAVIGIASETLPRGHRLIVGDNAIVEL